MQPIKYRQQTTFQIIIRNLSVSSSRALPFTLPPHPLICQQTFRQTASQTINPPSFRTSSIHPPPLPAYSQIDEAELGKEKTKTERRTKTTRALFSNNDACLLVGGRNKSGGRLQRRPLCKKSRKIGSTEGRKTMKRARPRLI